MKEMFINLNKLIKPNLFFRTVPLYCLLLVLSAWYPVDFLGDLQQKFNTYREKYPAVKMHIVFHQGEFVPGDTVFFRAWYLNDDFIGVKGEHIVTLDLFNGKGKTVQRVRFKVKNGKGYSQFALNKNLEPGEYNVLGYTDWMRNFGEVSFFKKRIMVVSRKQILRIENKNKLIEFYAEGGSLVAGLSNKMVVRGNPSTELIIKDKYESVITVAKLDSSGIGTFDITPQAGETYIASVPAIAYRQDLPIAVNDGVAIRMDQQNGIEFQLSIPGSSIWSNKEICTIVVSRGRIISKQKIRMDKDQPARFQVATSNDRDDLYQLYLFDENGKILGERIFVAKASNKIVARLDGPTEVYQRGNFSGTLEIADAAGIPLEADISVAVYQNELFAGNMAEEMYLMEMSEAMEWIERSGTNDNASINDFLITQKYERINWENVLSGKPITITYPFYSEAKIKGNVISKKSGDAAPDSTAVIGYLQTNTIGYEAYTKDGKFEMPLIYDFWGNDQIFYTLKYKSKSIDDGYNITLLTDTLNVSERWSATEINQSSRYGEYALNKDVVAKSYSFFGNKKETVSLRDQGLNSLFEDEFLGADFTVNVEEYLTFPSMADLLQEAVPFVHYRKRGTVESIRMSYRYEKSLKVFRDDPLYIIDGVMSKNTAFFLSLKPEDLLFIKILNNPNKLTQLGKLGENAVIFVESKKGNLSALIPDENLFPVVGLNRPKEFTEFNYSQATILKRIPDLRATLYWKPVLETNKSGKAEIRFSASDDTGPIKILVSGFTKDGRFFKQEKIIHVGFNAVR
ncbi:MAG: hypothetical protein C0490_04220 [Marivirga sp.]|nr:hypothetical protein [Marivirga sp.]